MKLPRLKFLSQIAMGLLFLSNTLMAHEGEHDTFTHFAGDYQSILITSLGEDPVGKIDFTVTSTGALSGSLLLAGQKSFSFKTSLTLNEMSGTAELTNFDVVKPKEGTDVKITLNIDEDGSFTVDGDVLLPTLTTNFTEMDEEATRLAVITDCPWAGSYTMAFPYVSNNGGTTPPGGASIGTASVKADGAMTATGNLADGTKFSFSARPSADGTYRVFFSPYKSGSNYFYTMFRLTNRGDGRYEVDELDGGGRWAKAANEKEKTYPLGFDVNLDAAVVEWVAPSGDQTLGDLLGLDPDKILDIDFFNGLSPSTYAAFLPTSLGLNLNNTFRIASANGGPLVSDAAAWSKIFSSKIDPNTGRITVTINITDLVAGKSVKRKVTVNGVFVQLANGLLDEPYAFGHLLIPPLDKKTGTLTSGGFDLPGPIYVDEDYAATANLVGTYSAQLTLASVLKNSVSQPIPETAPNGLPSKGAIVDFTISNDVSEMTFDGDKIPLFLDNRPFNVIYSNATDISAKNKLQVTLTLDGSGSVFALAANYIQISLPDIYTYQYNSAIIDKD